MIMKHRVGFIVLFCLMCLIFAARSEVQSAPAPYQTEEGHGMALFVQLGQDEESEYPYQTDQNQVMPDFGQAEGDQQIQDPASEDGDLPTYDASGEEYPATDTNEFSGDEWQREPSSSDEQYPSADTGEIQEEYPPDVAPSGTATTQTGAGAASGVVSQQAVPQQCSQASGHSIFRLTSAGINSGVSYLQAGSQVEFWNDSSVTHSIVITPSGMFSNDSFTITPGSKVYTFARSSGQLTRGRIVVNPGNGQTEHHVVVCP
jgi:plastocyanin